eukprot:2796870-Ditylum_brightwellii.AAC.1
MTRPTTTILIASDGSASKQENTMSFGWVLSLLNSKTFATHSGPAFGHIPLFQAEGYGLLSVTCFLYHHQSYTQLALACNICIYTDNKGVVTRTNNQAEYKYDYPYNTLDPDWDITTWLAEYLQMFGSNLKIEHYKSHQDDDCNFEQFDLPAQLNVQAEELATMYRVKISQPQAFIPQLSINDVQLVHGSGTITDHYFKKIQDIATEKALSQHLVETNSWTSEVVLWIDWPTFQRCHKSLDQKDNQIVKLSHNFLPTSLLLHKYDKLVSNKCTFFKASPETRDHLVQCKSAVVNR